MLDVESRIAVHRGDISESAYDEALSAGVVAWDIETSGLAWGSDRIGTCQIAIGDRVDVVIIDQSSLPERLKNLLADQRVTKVFHHAPFDLRFMCHQWAVHPENVACTKVASKILDPEIDGREHSLQPALLRHLGVRITKDQQVSDWLSSSLSPSQLRYAANDVVHLVRLYELLAQKCDEAGVGHELRESFAYLPTRVRLDLRGSCDVFAY